MKHLIFGAAGQTAGYLIRQLTCINNEIFGVIRKKSNDGGRCITYIEGDVSSYDFCRSIINGLKPDYIYNLAAQSNVGESFADPFNSFQVNAIGLLNILESIKEYSPGSTLVQASTSEMFGDSITRKFDHWGEIDMLYQDEHTPFNPRSPYAVSKLAAHHLIDIYRKSYGLKCSSAILFNHESPHRPESFVSRKITMWIGDFVKWATTHTSFFPFNPSALSFSEGHIHIKDQAFAKLRLGNIKTSRDWGHASDYSRALIAIANANTSEDYVVCTGESHSIDEFLSIAFSVTGIPNYRDYIVIDDSLFRPIDINYSNGSNKKINTILGWKPQISFKNMILEMVLKDIYRGINNG